jgi:hypothetical protein
LQRTNPGSNPLNLRGILFKRSGPALLAHSVSFESLDEDAPSTAGTKQLGSAILMANNEDE